MFKNKKWLWLIPISIIIILIIVWLLLLSRDIDKDDKERLRTEEYSAVFGSMYDISNYDETYFLEYRGLKTVKAESSLDSFRKLSKFMKIALESGQPVETIYLGIDPVRLLKKTLGKEDQLFDDMQKHICSTMEQFPEITFEFMLPAPYIAYWEDLDEEEFTMHLAVYQKTVDILSQYDNAVVFFAGAEEWLNCNGLNYEDDNFKTNVGISNYFLLAMFCDRNYRVNSDSMQKAIETLRNEVVREKQSPKQYADLSDWNIVFMGDSIIGLETTTSSIPDTVSALSGAKSYNCGECGVAVTSDADTEYDFNIMVDAIISNRTDHLPQDVNFVKGINDFISEEIQEDKLCFVINFGLNDYFIGYKVDDVDNPYNTETYSGALRTGIEKLQGAYPNAQIVVLAPTFTEFYSQGTELLSENGGELLDYVRAAEMVAEETKVLFKNNYEDMPMNGENSSTYLLDGCHLNGNARLIFAQQLIEFLTPYISAGE